MDETAPTPLPQPRLVVGCMTGTSLDGLDAALVEVTGRGLDLRARFLDLVSLPLGALRDQLRSLAEGRPAPPLEYLRAARALGHLHADAVEALLRRRATPPKPSPLPTPEAQGTPRAPPLALVVAHGQTIWHAPEDHLSWQLLDPWPIVRRFGIPVCCDLRQADLAAGGQGAPLTPLADWVLYRHPTRHRLVANLGGICNVTRLPAGGTPAQVTGEDLGPCNLLIDGVVRLLYPPAAFDRDGRLAAQGGASSLTYRLLRQAPFFQRPRPRSTGREDFTAAWVEQVVRDTGLPKLDQVTSAVDAVARLIVEDGVQTGGPVDEVILAGGGARNEVLVRTIRRHAPPDLTVLRSDELGIPAEAREAVGFAVLGALSQDGVAIGLPQVTGAADPGRAGVWIYP